MEIDGETVDEETGLRDFNRLTSDARVNYITEQIEYYGYSGERVKGLIFCSSKKEAVALSQIFNQRGYRTRALTGEDNQEKREEAIELLTRDISDPNEEHLDYILTVDIFNEGVDIPEINQVVLLRPTESPIVFVQQLGRGLRKATDKEYVVILDFIGNYKNNFMIPIALSSDRTYNKDNIRRYVMEGGKVIPGSSTIHFDEISRKRIFEAIDQSTTTKKMLVEKYNILKNRLGKIPSIIEFYEHGEIDPMLFIEYSKESYHKFLQMADKEYKVHFKKKQEDIASSTKYEDQFVDNQTFSWMTRSKVSLDSKEAQQIIASRDNGDKIFLFIKKSDGEGTDFYYMGEVVPTDWRQTTIHNDRGEELPIVNFMLRLNTPVREDLYEYLRS